MVFWKVLRLAVNIQPDRQTLCWGEPHNVPKCKLMESANINKRAFVHLRNICGPQPPVSDPWLQPIHGLSLTWNTAAESCLGFTAKPSIGPMSSGFCSESSRPGPGAHDPNPHQHSLAPSRVSSPPNSSYKGRASAAHYPSDLLKLQPSSCSVLLLDLRSISYFHTYFPDTHTFWVTWSSCLSCFSVFNSLRNVQIPHHQVKSCFSVCQGSFIPLLCIHNRVFWSIQIQFNGSWRWAAHSSLLSWLTVIT